MAKRIGAIVSLVLIAILIISTVIMANTSVNYSVQCNTPDDIYVSLGSNSSQPATDKQKEEILAYINNASQEKVLTALFSGNLGKHAELTSKKSTLSTVSNNFYIRYTYNQEQKLQLNGQEYKDESNKSVVFEDLIFVLEDVEDATELKVYVIPNDDNNMRYTYYYTVEGDFAELYSYLDKNF